MKIIIIGAGISGLSSYLLLRTHLPTAAAPAKAHEIVIYESYNANPHTDGILDPVLSSANGKGPEKEITIGGGLGVMQNGQAVIRRLSPELDEAINRAGYPISSFRISNARGWTLANFTSGASGGDVGPGGVLIARQAIWRCMRDEVLRRGGKIVQKKVVDITMDGGPAGDVKITFEDGGSDSADLLIGADGLRSICRRAVFAGTNTPESEYEARFEGLVGVGGFIPSEYLSSTGVPPGEMGIVFGADGFFGYGYSSSPSPSSPSRLPGPTAIWWSTYSTPPDTPCPNAKTFDRAAAQAQLLARHGHWTNPTIKKIIASVSVDTMWPTWTTPPLRTWSRVSPSSSKPGNAIVLVGDAAHALQPSSGQGSSMALEDSEALARLLGHHLRSAYQKAGVEGRARGQRECEAAAVRRAIPAYETLRIPRVAAVYKRGQAAGDMKRVRKGWAAEMLLYFGVWLMGFFIAGAQKQLINYDLPAEVEKVIREEK